MLSQFALAASGAFPVTYTNCGVEKTLQTTPEKVVTMNQGSLEFMLSMGLQDRIVGTRGVTSVLDPIWPKYKDAYNSVPVMSGADGKSYPSDAEVLAANADYIFADWSSAFSEYAWNNDTLRQWASVGECGGVNSDFWPAGENKTYIDKGKAPGYERKDEIESWCRPQLHDKGIGTFLSAVSCEDKTLRAPPIPDTLYDTIKTMGEIFNVPTVASQLVKEIEADFVIAQQTLQKAAGHSLTAVWLDCISCCDQEPELSVFVGSGGGAPQMIMKEAGFTNLFKDRENSWACVSVADIIKAEPDVMIVVEAGFDPALDKIAFMHNNADFCNANYVKNADYIKFPFSASTVGPRVGAAALDMVGAALKVTTGNTPMNFNSGIDFFDPQVLVDHTKDLLCPLPADYWKVKPNDDSDGLPAWAIALIAVFSSLFVLVLGGACYIVRREKQGKPIFTEVTSEVAKA